MRFRTVSALRSRVRAAGRQDVREAIGPTYSALEEAKADIVGLYGLKWLVDHGDLPREKLNGYYASEVAGIFRYGPFRRGRGPRTRRNHGIQFLLGTRCDRARRRFRPLRRSIWTACRRPSRRSPRNCSSRKPQGIARAPKRGLRSTARFRRNWRRLSEAASDVPVDIDPISAFPEPMR